VPDSGAVAHVIENLANLLVALAGRMMHGLRIAVARNAV
jgi:hypothetical protein